MSLTHYIVAIRRNADGQVRLHHSELPWDGESSLYWWTEGNMGCDCNREMLFDAVCDPDCDDDHVHCSEGRFSIEIRLDDGTVPYSELSAISARPAFQSGGR